ncbi:MAG: 50S ribosomal protein L15 [Pseudomonadales bacterium]|jgi:large subunit ribosomal protein L15
MRLNTIGPAQGSKKTKRRVGRGAGSGWGKTSARGQKGQKARTGGGVRPGFEGGQQPLKQRVPKFGFRSRVGLSTAEVRLGELGRVPAEVVDLDALKKANILSGRVKRARVILSGEISRPVTVKGLGVTRGARAAIEAAGGKVED